MDQTKLQEASSSRLHSLGSGGDAVATDQGDSSAWRKQRPGATFFEKLQVSYGHLLFFLHNRFRAHELIGSVSTGTPKLLTR